MIRWEIWGQSSLAGLAVCGVALVGGFAYLIPSVVLRQWLPLFISLSTGVLLGDAFLHLLPESLERIGNVQLVLLEVLAGIFLFFNLEKLIRWRHDQRLTTGAVVKPLISMNLLGDSLHNFLDGTLIAGSFLVSPTAGWATTAGLLLHELPQEVGDVGTLLYGGFSIRRAVVYNLLSALTCLLGISTVLLAGLWFEAYLIYLMPVAAGGFIYVASSDLIPELHRSNQSGMSWFQSLFVLMGIGLMLWLASLE
ncbi:ZIP family metal transporter [Spirosoma endbachense]|uniref:ZIP family metal transporter n=1 Tax=Spirosoma endbachense TaxID=2666025 RepID=A0A6P1W847_9BACT|nr:ZIP family metal transporter [Spirosoma endbachense]QHW00739.1 ZIP family metal transporter [Spirosoma endbachense]